MLNVHSEEFLALDGKRSKGSNTDIVCVDGSEGADRAMRYARTNTPKDHTLVLLHGAQVPRTLPERLFNYQVHRFAEGHYWDKDNVKVYDRYMSMCNDAGRKCEFLHFHYDSPTSFGEKVCQYARRAQTRNVIMGRRSDPKTDWRRRIGAMGSASQAVVNSCSEVAVTIVTQTPPPQQQQQPQQQQKSQQQQ